MYRTANSSRPGNALFVLALLAGAAGCTPSNIVGPLSHAEDERAHMLTRAWAAGVSAEILDEVDPPLTPQESELAREQDSSCRSSYEWKNAFTWTGSLLIAGAAGITIGSAYATGNSDTANRIVFGVGAGTLATLGSGLVAIGGIIANGFSDRGCMSKMSAK